MDDLMPIKPLPALTLIAETNAGCHFSFELQYRPN